MQETVSYAFPLIMRTGCERQKITSKAGQREVRAQNLIHIYIRIQILSRPIFVCVVNTMFITAR